MQGSLRARQQYIQTHIWPGWQFLDVSFSHCAGSSPLSRGFESQRLVCPPARYQQVTNSFSYGDMTNDVFCAIMPTQMPNTSDSLLLSNGERGIISVSSLAGDFIEMEVFKFSTDQPNFCRQTLADVVRKHFIIQPIREPGVSMQLTYGPLILGTRNNSGVGIALVSS
jgi:hypothetical protein